MTNLTLRKMFIRNGAWLLVSEFLNRGGKFLLIIFATSLMGPLLFGEFSYALATVALFGVIADFGIPIILTRELVGRRNANEFVNVVYLKMILTAIMVVITVIFAIFSAYSAGYVVLALLIGYIFLNSVDELIFSFFQSKKNLVIESKAKIIEGLFLFFGLILLFFWPTPKVLSAVYVGAATLSTFYLIKIFREHHTGSLLERPSKNVLKKYFFMSLPVAITAIFTSVYNNIDSVMMGLYGQITEVGLYNAAYKFAWLMIIPSFLIFKIFYPVLTEAQKRGNQLQENWDNYMRAVIYVTLPICLVAAFLAEPILRVVYGESFVGANNALKILMAVSFLMVLTSPPTQLLIIINKQKSLLWISMIAAFANVGINLFLIPLYSLAGAAFSTLISFVLILFLISVNLRRCQPELKIFSNKIKKSLLISFLFPTLVFLIFMSGNIIAEALLIVGSLFLLLASISKKRIQWFKLMVSEK